MNRSFYTSFIIFFLLVSFFSAQKSLSEALYKLNIGSITKDHYGRIWMGTNSGLQCYDGSQLIEFNSKKYQDFFPAGGIIAVVFNQVQKKLVITTKKGVVFFDPDNFTSKLLSLSDLKLKNLKNGIWFPCIDEKGNTWCSDNEGGLIKIDKFLNSKILRFKIPISSDLFYRYGNHIGFSSVSCSNGNIYFGTRRSEVCRYNVSINKVNVVSSDHRAISGIYNYGDDLVFSDFDGLHFKRESDTSIKSHIPAHLISFLYKDDNNELWYVLNKTQVFKLNENKKPELVYELSAEQVNKHKVIKAILVDHEKIWLATERGLLLINKPFKAIHKIFDKLPGYSNVELSSRGIVCKDDSIIICAGYNYLASFNQRSDEIKLLINKKSAQEIIPYGLCMSGDSLWIGCEGGGMRILSMEALELKRPELSNKVPPQSFVYGGLIKCITRVDSFICMGEYGLFGLYNLKTKKIIDSYSEEWKGNWAKEKTNNINQIVNLSKDELLFVAGGNIIITSKQFRIKNKIKPLDLNNNSHDFNILNVMIDKQGHYWISTDRAGLCLFNAITQKSVWFNTQNGLCDNIVYYSLESNDGRIWVATNYGLSVIDPVSKVINNYYEKDGLANNEFNTNSFLKASNGDLYLGGMKGITRIKPLLINKQKESDRFILTAVHLASSDGPDSIIQANLSALKQVVLPYHSRFLKVQFSLLNFSSGNKYSFRLIGLDTTWLSLGNNTSVVFNSLSPGSYTLQLKAWNERGDQVKEIISLPIESEQIFYKDFRFIILLAILFVGATGGVFYAIYKLKLRAINQMAEMRLRIASDLHDQVGGLLNKTASQAELVKVNSESDTKMLGKIADNSRIALNSMRDILWNLDPRNDNPESLVDRMSEYTHKMLEDTNSYELNLGDLKKVEMSHEQRQTINTVFAEAINNIVKHAPREKVEVKVNLKSNGFELTVVNTGKFLTKEVITGQGIKNMKMRMEKIGGTFSMQTEENVKIIFWLPLKVK